MCVGVGLDVAVKEVISQPVRVMLAFQRVN